VQGDLPALSVIIPAHNEEAVIGDCLTALFASTGLGPREAIVVANGCRDATVARAQALSGPAEAAGWSLRILDLPEGGKPAALRAGDAAAGGHILAYLDADVTVSEAVLSQLVDALRSDAPRYGSGTPIVAPAQSIVTKAYARFWATLPLVVEDVQGFGLFAMNRA
jgi:glycosyltransferase involved in cell wall biosynthesis